MALQKTNKRKVRHEAKQIIKEQLADKMAEEQVIIDEWWAEGDTIDWDSFWDLDTFIKDWNY